MPKKKQTLIKHPNRETMEFLLQHRGSRVPSGKAYKRRPKHGKGYAE